MASDMKGDPEILAALTPRNLVSAYCQGVFPMVEEGRLMWFRPDPRGLLPLDERFHVPRRLRRTIRSGRFACTVDRCFDQVIACCANRPNGEPTWISPEMRIAYGRLHELELAHSFEAWPADRVGDGLPVGGLYGVAIGAAFFGESMFHTVTDAGKVALVASVDHLRRRGFALYDIQWTTDNLKRHGAYEVSARDYQFMLNAAVGAAPSAPLNASLHVPPP